MSTHFTADFFRGNRSRLRAALNDDAPIILTAAGLLQRGGDNTFPFQQDSSFWYLTGINEPDITVVMDGMDEYLIVPGRSASRQAFDGAIEHSSLTATSGITKVCDDTEGWKRIHRAIRKHNKVLTPQALPEYVEQYGMYVNPARASLAHRLQKLVPGVELADIRQDVAGLRMIKQTLELEALQQAIDITMDSLELLTEPARFGMYNNEYELEADLTREFRFRGAAGHAFAPIIAGGKRAVTLHNFSNEAPLEADNLVILDVGAEVSHYAADITRTLSYGTATARQRQVYDAVLDVQSYALGLLKPGVILKEYEQAVETYMGKTLQKLKLIKTADHEAIRKYFPHATSHFLGLDVHDVGDYSRPLEPGMVLTCEPGIYIPEEAIGVRLEDDIVITAKGNQVMSGRLPKALS